MPDNDTLTANLIQRINVGDLLTRSAARYPDRLFVSDGRRRLSYAEFNALANRAAHGLLASGYRRGSALAVASGNSVEFLATYFACAKIGAVCVPINLGWNASEVAYVLNHSESRGVVIETQLVDTVAPALRSAPAVADVIIAPGTAGVDSATAVPSWRTFAALLDGQPAAEPECYVADRDPISFLYTSGTTSFPKGVVGSHAAIYLEALSVALEGHFAEDDRFAAMMPMFHTAQLNAFCTPAVAAGASIHLMRAFAPDALLDLIEAESITQLFGLPMMYRAMLDHPSIAGRNLTSLRRACYAMAPMPDEQLRRCLEVFDCGFYLLFGQTEMSPVSAFFRPEHQLSHPGAVGTPVVNVQIGVMDPDGALLPTGERGEIVYRGPHTLSEYLKDPAATDEAFRHGWFHSGDSGHFDDDGVLWFADRYKDVIKTGGENVASIEVEKAIYAADPNVAEAAVVGLPHDRWTEAVTAVVTAKPGASVDPDRIIAGVKARIAPFKAPKSVIVVDALPKTSTGKIQKNVVRQAYQHYYHEEGR